jgi:NAD(P)-dependent dehydrogenase (short-subunit alcohol dehydrogenase family)
MSDLSNKVAIVTGASKGIGGGIATALELRARAWP